VLINLCNSGPLSISNQLVTIHDLAFIKNPGWFHPVFSYWYNFMVPRLLLNSRVVMTVSETIRNEIVQSGMADKDKIIVIGNKVSDELLNAKEVPPSDNRITEREFFLMVGTDDPRKNFKFIEKFFANHLTSHKLVIAGGASKNFRKENHQQNENIIRTGYTTAGELKWLYRHATAFINPSLYEGFGIPNLEAMALNCPVICSDIPVFREICKNTVHYFDPNNLQMLGYSIRQVMENKMLTESKTLQGKVIFTDFQTKNRSSKIIKALFR
jgi:glycosyltransferase involved in cell wall biosynthesis